MGMEQMKAKKPQMLVTGLSDAAHEQQVQQEALNRRHADARLVRGRGVAAAVL